MKTMLTPTEIGFIQEYIVPNRRERLRFELSKSGASRDRAIDRFSHGARALLVEQRVHSLKYADGEFLLDGKRFDRIRGGDAVFVMSLYSEFDGRTLSFADALEKLLGFGPFILLGVEKLFAFIETEPGGEDHEYLYLTRSEPRK